MFRSHSAVWYEPFQNIVIRQVSSNFMHGVHRIPDLRAKFYEVLFHYCGCAGYVRHPFPKNGSFGRTCNDSSTLVVSARTSSLHLQYRYKTTHLQHDRSTLLHGTCGDSAKVRKWYHHVVEFWVAPATYISVVLDDQTYRNAEPEGCWWQCRL